MIILITGICGTGKTTVGTRVAEKLSIPYFDGDDFHPKQNIDKMGRGIPLKDEDRWAWLEAIRGRMERVIAEGASAVFTCSALKKSYRSVLMDGIREQILFVYLYGDLELIRERMKHRPGHYMKESMILSQLRDLELPEDGLHIDVSMEVECIVEKITTALDISD